MKFYEVVVYLPGVKECHTFDLSFRNEKELKQYLRSLGFKESEIVSIRLIGGV